LAANVAERRMGRSFGFEDEDDDENEEDSGSGYFSHRL
jgi:hypothetical protein